MPALSITGVDLEEEAAGEDFTARLDAFFLAASMAASLAFSKRSCSAWKKVIMT